MKKKIISLLLAVSTVFSAGVASAYWGEGVDIDPLSTDLFNIISEIKDIPEEEIANQGEIIEEAYFTEDGVLYKNLLFANGTQCKNIYVADVSEFSYMTSPTAGFPAYMENAPSNIHVGCITEQTDDKTLTEKYYIVGTEGNEYVKELICIVEHITDGSDYKINIYDATEENGEIAKTLLTETPLTQQEFYENYYGNEAEYNDGLIFKYDSSEGMSGLVDVNGDVVFSSYATSYYTMDYNLGYVNESENNGGSLDWGNPDLDGDAIERQRRYYTTITDVVNGNKYEFDNTFILGFDDNGYGQMFRKDEQGNEIAYLIKLNKYIIVTVTLDGQKIAFDQLPVIKEGRTLVPLRAIFESLEAEVSWDENTRTVTAIKGETEIKLTIDNNIAYKNGEEIKLEVPAQISGGRTLVPVRFVADCFGVGVDWDQDTKRVILTTN